MNKEELELQRKQWRKMISDIELQIAQTEQDYVKDNCEIKKGDIIEIKFSDVVKDIKYVDYILYNQSYSAYKQEFMLYCKNLKGNGRKYKTPATAYHIWGSIKAATTITVIDHGEVPKDFEEFVDKHRVFKEEADPKESWFGFMYDTDNESHRVMVANAEIVAGTTDEKVVCKHIWTLVDAGNKMFISPGHHVVNRMGYFVTQIPYGKHQENIDILLD